MREDVFDVASIVFENVEVFFEPFAQVVVGFGRGVAVVCGRIVLFLGIVLMIVLMTLLIIFIFIFIFFFFFFLVVCV